MGIDGGYHADGLAGSHVVVVGVPLLEFGVLSVLQDVLLALKVGMIVADPGAALHTDGVHPEGGRRGCCCSSFFNVLCEMQER